jgi:Ca2+-binding EF-hand superfamily protein
VIFKVYDVEGRGKVTFKDILLVLRNLTGSFMTEEQREVNFSEHMFLILPLFTSDAVVFICELIWLNLI